ncbi:Potassium-transporting ATPase A subunit [Micromonospora matsumotoense]|uniref:Potassium-transporting ATPase A subunit n=1 Tax=Micromonospora matsumotoense TaxID=121616 RepID=A0A1C4Y305_9ACTN|nr:Potassium-transporting ATPase A subunit [Micromonospora matsumotoense]
MTTATVMTPMATPGTTTAGVVFVLSLVVALVAAYRPVGDQIYRVVAGTRQSRVERGVVRLVGVNPAAEQSWGVYARSLPAFSAVSVLFLHAFPRWQDHLWLSLGFGPVGPHGAWNTAVSFVTNTNWQWYPGESTMGHLVQMAGLAVQNFLSAAVGIAVAVALVRGFARSRTGELGDFWVDLVRITLRVLLPVAVLGALVLMLGGVVQNLSVGTDVTTLTGGGQTVTGGPEWPRRSQAAPRPSASAATAPTTTRPSVLLLRLDPRITITDDTRLPRARKASQATKSVPLARSVGVQRTWSAPVSRT